MELPTILLAGSIGVWLFYVQHQFEMTFWAHEGEWTFQEAALHGSSPAGKILTTTGRLVNDGETTPLHFASVLEPLVIDSAWADDDGRIHPKCVEESNTRRCSTLAAQVELQEVPTGNPWPSTLRPRFVTFQTKFPSERLFQATRPSA